MPDRPAPAVSRDGAINNVRVVRAYRVFTEAQAGRNARAVVLNEDIRIFDQPQDMGDAGRRLQIDLETMFAAVLCTERQAHTLLVQLRERTTSACPFAPGWLDFQHLCA